MDENNERRNRSNNEGKKLDGWKEVWMRESKTEKERKEKIIK